MYRPHTILARTISIELTLRRSSSEIAATKLDSIQQLIRGSLRPLFKRRFSPRASQPILGLANPFQGTMLTEVGSGKSIEIVLFALVLFFMWKRWSHLS